MEKNCILQMSSRMPHVLKREKNLTIFTESAYEEMREGWDRPKQGGKGLVHSECSHSARNMKNCFTWSILHLRGLCFMEEKHTSPLRTSGTYSSLSLDMRTKMQTRFLVGTGEKKCHLTRKKTAI